MEPKCVKVLDSSSLAVDFKRKRPHQVSIDHSGDSSFFISIPESMLSKRRKLNMSGSTEYYQRPIGKSVVRYYLNFIKSGQPERVMYNNGGKWTSFPLLVLDMVKEHFMKRNPIFEVELNGNVYLLDFIHMAKFDLKSGQQQSIAWIDEEGNCFFPKIFSNEDDVDSFVYEAEVESATSEIQLQFDIDINVVAPSNLYECTGESKDPSAHDGFSGELGVNFDDTKYKEVAFDGKFMDMDNIRSMFLNVMGSYDGIEILDVYRDYSPMLQAHKQLFLKQVEITAKHRGNANVRYAWLPCTKGALSSIMKYGIASVALSSSIYGVGVHLLSDCADLRVNLSDVDENGVQYVVLCQVTLGKMEVVNHGSDQFHPSTEDYDTGVDNLMSPRYHIIWNMDLNSRVYPECVISFKTSSGRKGFNVEQNVEQDKVCDSEVTGSHLDRHKVLLQSASNKMHALKPQGVNNVTARIPMARKPAWMPFPVLFAAISHQVAPNAMKLIMTEYDLFKKEKKSRDDFVKKLRVIVGDQLLMSTIKQLQDHPVSPSSEMPNLERPNLGRVVQTAFK